MPQPTYAGLRSITRVGNSLAVTLPITELREIHDVDLEAVQGQAVFTRIEDGKFIVQLPTDEQ